MRTAIIIAYHLLFPLERLACERRVQSSCGSLCIRKFIRSRKRSAHTHTWNANSSKYEVQNKWEWEEKEKKIQCASRNNNLNGFCFRTLHSAQKKNVLINSYNSYDLLLLGRQAIWMINFKIISSFRICFVFFFCSLALSVEFIYCIRRSCAVVVVLVKFWISILIRLCPCAASNSIRIYNANAFSIQLVFCSYLFRIWCVRICIACDANAPNRNCWHKEP